MRILLDIPLLMTDVIRQIIGAPVDAALPDTVPAIVTDSREAMPGDLFFAMVGERYDGHDYVASLLKEGVYAVTSRRMSGCILVDSTVSALQKLSAYYKTLLPHLKATVAVTGSVGKTTVKNLCRELLLPVYQVHATTESLNNQIGLPLTILSASRNTEILILEMGTNHVGEISVLSQIAKPDYAVITGIGTAHIGNFGSKEAIAREKSDVIKGLSESGRVFLPADEPLLFSLPKAVTVGLDCAADRMILLRSESENGSTATYYGKDNTFDITFRLPGKAVLFDLCFALALAEELNIPGPFLKDTVNSIDSSLCRFSIDEIGDIKIIDDTYNASLESVKAGLSMLKNMTGKRKIVLLGDILESGSFTESIHEAVGKSLTENDVNTAFFFGVYSSYLKKGAILSRLPESRIFCFLDTERPREAVNALCSYLLPGDVLYAKASHGVGLSRIVSEVKKSLRAKG